MANGYTRCRVEAARALLRDLADEYELTGAERDEISRTRHLLEKILDGAIERGPHS